MSGFESEQREHLRNHVGVLWELEKGASSLPYSFFLRLWLATRTTSYLPLAKIEEALSKHCSS
jgi:hypothetical protein